MSPDGIELALGHSIKGIRAHYDDPGEYQPMIDTAVQAVANEVERIAEAELAAARLGGGFFRLGKSTFGASNSALRWLNELNGPPPTAAANT